MSKLFHYDNYDMVVVVPKVMYCQAMIAIVSGLVSAIQTWGSLKGSKRSADQQH